MVEVTKRAGAARRVIRSAAPAIVVIAHVRARGPRKQWVELIYNRVSPGRNTLEAI